MMTLNRAVMRIQRVIREKCLEQQLAQTECSGSINWHDYPKEGNGGADPKGHFRLVMWPPLSSLSWHLWGAVISPEGEVSAWP